MITLYSGTPGSGKSYHMAEMICLCYKRGKNIFCNFEVDIDYLKEKYPKSKSNVFCIDNRDLKYPFGLSGFSANFSVSDSAGRIYEKQSYLFIDECQNNFDARTWNEKGRREWNHWLSEHRKDGFEVILCTQSDSDIDKKIRGRIEYEVKHFKANNFKLLGRILGLLCGGNLFVQRSQWYTKGKSAQNKLDVTFTRGKKKYYRLFNTSKRFMQSIETRAVWNGVGV